MEDSDFDRPFSSMKSPQSRGGFYPNSHPGKADWKCCRVGRPAWQPNAGRLSPTPRLAGNARSKNYSDNTGVHPGCSSSLTKLFQQGGDNLQGAQEGLPPLQSQAQQIHPQQGRFLVGRNLGEDGFIADHNPMFVETASSAPHIQKGLDNKTAEVCSTWGIPSR